MKQTLFAGITIIETFEVLEPYDGKLSSTVLRGEEGRKPLALPGAKNDMGIIICKTHGRTGLAHVCSHIYNAAIRNETIPKFNTFKLEYNITDEPSWLKLHLCSKCIDERGLTGHAQEISEREQDDATFESKLESMPLCAKCFQENIKKA